VRSMMGSNLTLACKWNSTVVLATVIAPWSPVVSSQGKVPKFVLLPELNLRFSLLV